MSQGNLLPLASRVTSHSPAGIGGDSGEQPVVGPGEGANEPSPGLHFFGAAGLQRNSCLREDTSLAHSVRVLAPRHEFLISA